MKNNAKFWTTCSENDIKLSRGKGRLDPVLKIYIGCRVTLTTNIDVKNGQANGTQALIESVQLKENAILTKTNKTIGASGFPTPSMLFQVWRERGITNYSWDEEVCEGGERSGRRCMITNHIWDEEGCEEG